MKTRAAIAAQIDLANAAAREPGLTSWPAMSYECGVQAALRWVLGEESSAPMEGGQ